MRVKQGVEYFQHLPLATQVALIVFALVVVMLLAIYPTAGTSIIAFLVALKMLITRH